MLGADRKDRGLWRRKRVLFTAVKRATRAQFLDTSFSRQSTKLELQLVHQAEFYWVAR